MSMQEYVEETIDYNDLEDWSLDDLVDELELLKTDCESIISQLILDKQEQARGVRWQHKARVALSHKQHAIRKVERRIGEISDNPVDVDLIKRSYEYQIQNLREELNREKKKKTDVRRLNESEIKKRVAKVHRAVMRKDKSMKAISDWVLANYPERYGEFIMLINQIEEKFDKENPQ